MMEALRTWLYGVFCAALLLTLIQGLLPKGKFRSYASLAGGLILLLALLTPEEKAVFTAYFLEQQTMRDIAAAQQLTENQVKAVIRRIRRRAKTLFEENFS